MRKSYCKFVISMVLIFALCTGCASYTTGDETGVNVTGSAVSGSAVTGSAVSGAAVTTSIKEAEPWDSSGKEKKRKHFFANATNVYRQIENDVGEVKGFVQYTRSGKKQKTYKWKGFQTLMAVTEEGLYYGRKSEDDKFTQLCRIPLGKNADGTDYLKVGQTEVILTEKSGIQRDEAAYVDDDYIVYVPYKECVVKYDRKTGKRKELPTAGNINHIVSTGSEYLIVVSVYSGLLRLDLDSEQWEQIGAEEAEDIYYARSVYGKYFFYTSDESDEDDIWVYNGKTKETSKLISAQQMDKAIDQIPIPNNSWEIKQTEKTEPLFYYLCDLFCLKDRLFIQLQVEWGEGEKRWGRYVLFSVDLSDGNTTEPELRYERKLTDLLGAESGSGLYYDYPKETDGEIYSWNPSRVIDMVDGKAIMSLYRENKDRQELGCYDWEEDEFYRLEKDEGAEYVSLYYDNKLPFSYEERKLEIDMALMPEYLE